MSWFDLLAAPLLAGFFIATLAAPLGCLVVWRRMAFVSDTMAHAALLGLALAAPLHIGSEFGIILITAVLVILLSSKLPDYLPTDALLAGFSAASLALGMILISATGQNSALQGLLFGDILSIAWPEALFYALICVLGLVWLWFRLSDQLRIISSQSIATAEGLKPQRQLFEFLVMVAAFTLAAMSAIGALLISALLVLPALSARLCASSIREMLIVSLLISWTALAVGSTASVLLDTPTSPSIVAVLTLIFAVCLLTQRLRKTSSL